MPDISEMEPVADNKIHDSLREIILGANDIKQVGKIATYSTAANILKIECRLRL
jgi:hypothetical protein